MKIEEDSEKKPKWNDSSDLKIRTLHVLAVSFNYEQIIMIGMNEEHNVLEMVSTGNNSDGRKKAKILTDNIRRAFGDGTVEIP